MNLINSALGTVAKGAAKETAKKGLWAAGKYGRYMWGGAAVGGGLGYLRAQHDANQKEELRSNVPMAQQIIMGALGGATIGLGGRAFFKGGSKIRSLFKCNRPLQVNQGAVNKRTADYLRGVNKKALAAEEAALGGTSERVKSALDTLPAGNGRELVNSRRQSEVQEMINRSKGATERGSANALERMAEVERKKMVDAVPLSNTGE